MGVGQFAHSHYPVHELKVPGKSTNVGIVPFLLGCLEIDRGFLLWLDHSGTGENARMPLGFPVLLDSLVSQFQDRINDLLSLVSALLLAWRA